MWSVADAARVFVSSAARVWARDAAAGDGAGTAKFDKDDPLAVEFVAAVALLRSSNYGILTQSLFDAKGMAGNIVHAVATTNAIVGGLIVVEALKVLRDARRRRDGVERDGDGDYASSADTPLPFRYTFVKQHKTNNRLLEPIEPDAPNAKCAVCGGARMELVCDADSFTLGRLVDDVLMKKLGMCAPEIEAPETTLFLQPDDLDEDEAAMYAKNRTTALRRLPAGGVGGGTELDVSDFSQKFDFKLLVTHRPADEWDEETDPDGFILRGDETAIGEGGGEGAEGGDANGGGEEKEEEEDDDDVCIVDDEVEPAAAVDAKRKRDDDDARGDEAKAARVA